MAITDNGSVFFLAFSSRAADAQPAKTATTQPAAQSQAPAATVAPPAPTAKVGDKIKQGEKEGVIKEIKTDAGKTKYTVTVAGKDETWDAPAEVRLCACTMPRICI